MSRLHEPLTLPKHPELLHKINQVSIDIKLTHLADKETKEKVAKSEMPVTPPSWNDIVDLLKDCYKAINEQREDPRKY